MERERIIQDFWRAVTEQDGAKIALFFTEDAVVLWPNSNERFTISEFICANCEYPGRWSGHIEQIAPDGGVSVVKVCNEAGDAFRAVSFYQWRGAQICRMEEYWGDVAPAPAWRQALGIGTALTKTDAVLPMAVPVGRCGFFCGTCPSWIAGGCSGCRDAHAPGDCFTWDCTAERGLSFCPLCGDFTCGQLLEREKATVLDKSWLRWKRQERV